MGRIKSVGVVLWGMHHPHWETIRAEVIGKIL